MSKLQVTPEKVKGSILQGIETNPILHKGQNWVEGSWLIERLGVSQPTFRKLRRKTPGIRETRKRDSQGRVILLIGLGDTDPATPYDQVKRMKRIWHRKLRELQNHPKVRKAEEAGRRRRTMYTTKSELCQMLALAGKAWPTDKAPALFKITLDHWDTFMAGAKYRAVEQGENPDSLGRFYHLPNIGLICKYADVTLEMAESPGIFGVPDVLGTG